MAEAAAVPPGPQTPEETCAACSKPQSQLSLPLKRCAKCQDTLYCSRDCQRAHWRTHKRDCAAAADQASRSLVNPPKEAIIEEAKHTGNLLDAVVAHPLFDRLNPRSAPPTLFNVSDFLQRTWTQYIMPLCSARATMTIAADLEHYPGRATAQQHLAECPSGCSACEAWPPFDKEKWTDIITRNLMIASIILDEGGRQTMFGGRFDFGDEIRQLAMAVKAPRRSR